MTPAFLTRDEVIALHAQQINRYGGSHGVRDMGLLDAALGMPQQSFGGQYVHADIPAMAVAYLFHLVKNHPFVDGNKRIGSFAADVFLITNGLRLSVRPQELVDAVLAVATSQLTKDALAELIRQNVQPIAPP